MATVISRQVCKQVEGEKLQLFVVWIDCNCGFGDSDWEMNSPPKSLPQALNEAVETRLRGFPTKVMLEDQTPRPDGFFSNPLTDP